MIAEGQLGLICKPSGQAWHVSHAQCPFAQSLSGARQRIHFSARDAINRSRGAWVDLEHREGQLTIVGAASTPSLDIGRIGAFDDAGAMPGSLVEDGSDLLLYYTGWTLGRTVPFILSIGLARSKDGGTTFERVHESPVLGRNRHDPFLTASPWVVKEGSQFRMWYVSATEWVRDETGNFPTHYYTIKHAVSVDGFAWETSDQLCLPYEQNEHAIARPIVTVSEAGYRMIYSARRLGETYRIYMALSSDGIVWRRQPGSVLDVARSGWDSEMVCYASWLGISGDTFLLYNGNSYGRDGFGAVRLRST